MVRICKESFHQRQGYEILSTLAGAPRNSGPWRRTPWTGGGGPPDVRAQRRRRAFRAESMKWKIKRESNDELRQRIVDRTVQQAETIGLTVPGPDLKWNEERGHYDFGPIDWDEFWNVVATPLTATG